MNAPKLRFKADDGSEYPEWEKKQIGEVGAQIKTSINPHSLPDNEFVEYSMPAFDNGQADIVKGSNMNSARKILTEPCVLLNKLNVRKKRIWVVEEPEENAVCSSEFIPLTSNSVSLRYMGYYFVTDDFTNYLLDCSSGSSNSQKRVTPDIIMRASISCPCLAEQTKIVDFFSILDQIIEKTQEEIDTWEKQKSGVMQALFSQKLRFKADDGSEFPEWEEKKLRSFCDIVTKQTGFDYTATIKPALINQNLENTLPYLQTKNFSGVDFDYNTDYYIPVDIAAQFPKIILDRVSVLFSIVGASVGNVALFPATVKCFLSGAICVAKPIREDDATYIYYFMESPGGQKQIHDKTKGGGQATITIEDIRDFVISIPETEEEQRKITDCLSAFDTVINKSKQELEAYQRLKKGLLQQMFI